MWVVIAVLDFEDRTSGSWAFGPFDDEEEAFKCYLKKREDFSGGAVVRMFKLIGKE